ncbi:MAG: DNA-binding domain-containing protein [Sulfuritalea sp.]|nr:DNA-binding domain-containing protein [Sulfuritalea sp.]MDP1983375.1 DNA-binding domain-containing protein [Sulfuritalea sp.]
MSTHQVFAEALLATEPVCPPGLTTWNGSAPEKRFAVYRNNVVVGLIDALADSFPVTQELVGEQFFRAMARQFVRASPPRSPVLTLYGEGFAEFIEAFPEAAGLPYLADMARLELLRVQAWHAADAEPLAADKMSRLLGDVEALPEARFALHPSLRILRSRHAVVSMWSAHQSESAALALAQVAPALAETALVRREGLDVEISAIADGAATFIDGLQQGAAFGHAAQQALGADPGFDLAATLGMLIRGGLLASATTPRSATS